ncbi:hypothetical protein HGA91_01265 [candidate division WWE3 bacterium]|nr:hypothetical protein [candidate division WWE3 bacterium]
MMNFINKHKLSLLVGSIIAIVLLFGIALLFEYFARRPTQSVIKLGGSPTLVDELSNSPVDIEFVDGRQEMNVSRMADIELALPESRWFTNSTMQLIGFTLGLTDKATVSNQGEQFIWSQDNKVLSIDPKMGVINFSTAFNLGPNNLAEGKPSPEQLSQALTTFLDKVKLPKDFISVDLVNVRYMLLDPDGNIQVSATGSGPLLISDITYSMNGASIILPITTSIMIDSTGTIRNLSLFLPNVRNEDSFTNVLSIGEARRKMENGAADAIYLTDPENRYIHVDSITPAYYADNYLFHSINEKRTLLPAYIFSGPEGKVILLNKR